MTGIHAAAAPALIACLAILAIVSGACVAAGRGHGAVEWARRGLLAVVAAQAAVGLALAHRGGMPAEWIHWLYGPAIIATLLLPGALRDDLPVERRTGAVAVSSVLAALLAWRLWASG